MTQYEISILSDTICPWCYVGKKRLERATEQHRSAYPDDSFTTSWRPFYMRPYAPKKSTDKLAIYDAEHGGACMQVVLPRLARLGKDIGIDSKFGGKTGNSRDSHRLIQLGRTKSEDMQTKVVGEFFAAYFENEEDITDKETLVKRGVQAGMGEKEVRKWLDSDASGAEVDREDSQAKRMFVTGVPHFTINGKFEVHGAEESATFLEAFKRVKETQGGPSGKPRLTAESDVSQNAC